MTSLYNPPTTKEFRRKLRTNPTAPEVRLWSYLHGRPLGLKFRRQHGIGPYVLDFYSHQLQFGIEVDGDSHYQESGQQKDEARTRYLASLGISLLRFTNTDVMQSLDGVAEAIERAAQDLLPSLAAELGERDPL